MWTLIEDVQRWAHWSEFVALGFGGQVRRLRGIESRLRCVFEVIQLSVEQVIKELPWPKENDGQAPSRAESLESIQPLLREVENEQIDGPNIQPDIQD